MITIKKSGKIIIEITFETEKDYEDIAAIVAILRDIAKNDTELSETASTLAGALEQ